MEAPIDTGRLLLRRVNLAEARALLAGTPLDSTPCAGGYPTPDTRDAFRSLIEGERPLDRGPWLIIRKADGLVIGDIGLDGRPGPGVATGGYGLVPSAWGRGFATEALRALIARTFEHPGIRRIEADTGVTNIASRRVMEKAGMHLEREADGLLYFALER